MLGLVKKIFGDTNERDVKRLMKTVEIINGLEPEFVALSDEALKSKTEEFRARIEKGETLEEILPEAFATVREASNGRWACGILTYSWLEVWRCMKAGSPR